MSAVEGRPQLDTLKISVVTPSFNQARFLRATLESVLNQGYEPLEYIVMDGGSSDGSKEIIRSYSERLARWVSAPDAGQADAIAKGFEQATGDILCWVNSDDLLLPGALREVAALFARHPEVEAVSGGAYYVDAEGRQLPRRFGTQTLGVSASYDYFRFYGQDGVFQPATFWRRSAYLASGGLNRTLQFAMDLDLFTRLAERRAFHRHPVVLAACRIHPDAKSARLQSVCDAECKEIAKRNGVEDCSRVQRWVLNRGYRVRSLVRKLIVRARFDLDLVRWSGP